MYLYQGKKIKGTVKIGDNNYPATWFANATQAQRDDLGVTYAADIPKPDPHLYDSTENDDGTWASTSRDPAVIAEEDALAEDDAAIKTSSSVQAFLDMRPAGIDAYVEATAVKVILKMILRVLLFVARRSLR